MSFSILLASHYFSQIISNCFSTSLLQTYLLYALFLILDLCSWYFRSFRCLVQPHSSSSPRQEFISPCTSFSLNANCTMSLYLHSVMDFKNSGCITKVQEKYTGLNNSLNSQMYPNVLAYGLDQLLMQYLENTPPVCAVVHKECSWEHSHSTTSPLIKWFPLVARNTITWSSLICLQPWC